MTDATELQQETPPQEEINYKELYEKSQADLKAVAAKKEELLSETKRAKSDQRDAAEQARIASEAKAAKDGEFEKLWQTTKVEKELLMNQLNDIKGSHRKEKINVASMRIATELADGDNAELLSDFVSRNLDKIADDTGAVTSDVLDAVKNDFKNNAKYRALLRSSKATGGGAPGNKISDPQSTKLLTRSDFNNLDQSARGKFFASGGKLTE